MVAAWSDTSPFGIHIDVVDVCQEQMLFMHKSAEAEADGSMGWLCS